MSTNGQKRSRATHTKSRQGCYTCKSRRCDEAKPICGACALRSEPCGYPTSTSRQARRERQDEVPMAGEARQRAPAFSYDGSPRALDFDLPSPSVPRTEVNPTSMNMVDLRLLSHFMIRTSKHMSLSPYRQQVWETLIPKLATDHEFLMHLLLALAGLDDFPLDSQPAGGVPSGGTISSDSATSMQYAHHMQIVVGHHQCGLQGFRDQLSTLSNANCHQVFAGSMLLVAFAFASLRVRNWSDSHMSISTTTTTPLPKLRLDWIYLIRGLTTVVVQCWPRLRMGPFREILQYPGATEDWKMYPDTMFTTVAAPAGCSPRIARFCSGAFEAISRLRSLQDATPSPMDADSPFNSGLDQASSALRDGLELLESMYMRILYVVQFSRDETNTGAAVAVAIQADMENAAVMGWPQALSEPFLASLGSPDVTPNASLVVLAHLYLTLALFEATWFLNGAFDEEIMKIDALLKASHDETFIALIQWPVTVLNG